MAQIVLDLSGVPPIVGQLVTAGVAQNVAADPEREAGRLASARDHALVACHTQGRQALGNKHVQAGLPLALKPAQGAEFAPANRRAHAVALVGSRIHLETPCPQDDLRGIESIRTRSLKSLRRRCRVLLAKQRAYLPVRRQAKYSRSAPNTPARRSARRDAGILLLIARLVVQGQRPRVFGVDVPLTRGSLPDATGFWT